MAVSDSDIQLYQSANMNNDETSTQGGAINTSNQITGATVGEVIAPPLTSSNPVGGLDRVHYKKYFLKNNNGSSAYSTLTLWWPSLLIAVVTTGTITLVSTSTADTMSVLITGLDNSSNPVQETLALNGTTVVTSVNQYSHLQSVETVGDANVAGTVTIKDHGALVLGSIPPPTGAPDNLSFHAATGELQIGLATAKNDSGTTTNSTTAPSGVTFSIPNTQATGLTLPGDGNLDAGDDIGIWIKLTTKAGLASRTDLNVPITMSGTV